MADSKNAHPDDGFLDRLLDVPVLIQPSISPPGLVAAWSWGGRGAVAEAYLRATNTESEPLRLHSAGEDIVVQSWRHDGAEFLLALTRDGTERVQLMRAAIAKVAPVAVTDAQPKFYISGGELHPNGRWLIFAANFDPATGQETETSWVFRQDLVSGERIVLAKPRRANRTRPTVNAAGTHVLYSRKDRHPAGRQYWLVDIEGKNDREILNLGDDVEIRASWTPSGQQVVVVADSDTHRRVGLWLSASSLIHWIFDDPHIQIDDAFVPYGTGSMVAIESQEGAKRAWLYDVAAQKKQPWFQVPGATLLPLAPLSGSGWAARFYHARQPADLMRVGADAGKGATLTSLTGLPKAIGELPSELIAPEDMRWQASDGLRIQGWLYRAKEPRGTIVEIHGGPTYHVENRFDAQTQYLLRRGFNVFVPNYRGSTGFGLRFQNAILKQGWGGAEQQDIRSGIAALVEKGIAMKGRIGVTGVSYGGYSSWWAITHFPRELVAAAAPICGMTDLVVDYETTRPDLRLYSEQMMGGSPTQAPQRYRERSPIHHVANIKGRLLIVQGMRDPNVTPENLAAVRRALEAAKIGYELLTFEDEGHGIRKRANNRLLYRRLADFFEAAFAAAG